MRSLGLFGKPKVRLGNSLHERNCWSPPQLDRNLFAQINNAAVRFEHLIVTMFEAASHRGSHRAIMRDPNRSLYHETSHLSRAFAVAHSTRLDILFVANINENYHCVKDRSLAIYRRAPGVEYRQANGDKKAYASWAAGLHSAANRLPAAVFVC